MKNIDFKYFFGFMFLLFVASTVQATQLLTSISSVSANGVYTCALTTGGGVECWGSNIFGQLGDNQASGTQSTIPVNVVGLSSGVSAITTGWDHACAVMTTGGVECWGTNTFGQLGDNTTTNRLTPVDVVGLGSGVSAVTAGASQTCALTTSGGVECWGTNTSGQLGDNQASGTQSKIPVNVEGLNSGVSAIASGQQHTCALTTAGGVVCWGDNTNGQLGDNQASGTQSTIPVNVVGLSSGVSAIAASSFHSCALTTSGGVKCWGSNGYGELGDGTTVTIAPHGELTPVNVVGLSSGVSAIATGIDDSCALMAAGGVKCWGKNFNGELGDNQANGTQSSTPVNVVVLVGGVNAITGGSGFTCALLAPGGVGCWGYNGYGELGNNTIFNSLAMVNVVAAACPAGTYTRSNHDGSTECVQTPAGTYSGSDGILMYCPAGTYNPNTGSTSSAACLQTPAGSYSTAGSASYTIDPAGTYSTSNGILVQCLSGTYNPNTGSTSSAACLPTDVGYFANGPGNVSETQCAAGSYQPNTGKSSCIADTTCTVGVSYETTTPTLTSDRVCSADTACKLGTSYQTTAPTLVSDRVCSAVSVCTLGSTHETSVPTLTSDRVCTIDTVCTLDISYEISAPTLINDRICSADTLCTIGVSYQTVAPTLMSDRVCSSDTVCATGVSYQSIPPTLSSDRVCVPYTPVQDCATYSPGADACTACQTGYILSGNTCVVRSPNTHIHNDFNGDGKTDVFLLRKSPNYLRYWTDAVKAQTVLLGSYSAKYAYAGAGDFDGDGKADLLFTNASNQSTLIWSGAVNMATRYPGTITAGFSVAAICDTDGDGKDDIVWFNATTGSTRIWPGANKAAVTYPGIQNTAYAIVACADFDGDKHADIFWRNTTTGADQVWLGGQKSSLMYPGANTDLTVQVVGAGDTDGDGQADLVWYTPSTNSIRVWPGGLKAASTYLGTGATGFTPKAIGDYDGDGMADLLWSNDTTLATQIWPAFTKAKVTYPGAYPTGFTIQK